MRLLNLVAGVLAVLAWGWILYLGITLVDVIACANLPKFSTINTQLFNVVIPAAMIALVVASVFVNNWVKQPGRAISWFPVFALVAVLAYYGFTSGMPIGADALGGCPF
jgi:hypothetical protein